MEKIILLGFGGHARSVADSIEKTGKYQIIGYTDEKKTYPDNGYAYLGSDEELARIYESGIHLAFVTVGQLGTGRTRHMLYERLKQIGFELPVIIDPSAIVADHVVIEEGTYVGKGTIVNSNSHIGKMCIINTGALCEHDNVIGDFCHIAVRAVSSGMVTIGSNSFIGANATIIQGVNLGNEVVIGAGSVVLHDVKDKEKRYGIV